MERIAVQCKTVEDWRKVVEREVSKGNRWCNDNTTPEEFNWTPDRCINIQQGMMHCELEFYKDEGYKIISAAEYLNEGGKDVSEFKVGDEVECIDNDGGTLRVIKIGQIYTISDIRNGCEIYLKELEDDIFHLDERFKLITKTQTTKENKMNVNSTVAKVFKNVDDAILVTKYLGREYEEGNHRAYLDLKANDKVVLAEAKRLEKEEKE